MLNISLLKRAKVTGIMEYWSSGIYEIQNSQHLVSKFQVSAIGNKRHGS